RRAQSDRRSTQNERTVQRFGTVWQRAAPHRSYPALEWRAVPAAHDDVECETEGPLGLRQPGVEPRDQASPRAFVMDRLKNRIAGEQRVVRKVHLGDEACQEARAEE